ncbi:MAG TPA: hypothetical protein VH165_16125 [Kofleriaceae bacterium]|jgi:hypothetical protein|nr:hypothetical protein [Kofleriaceae bacterium]
MTGNTLLIASLLTAAPTAALASPAAAAAPDPTALERTLATQGWSPGVLFELGAAYATAGHPGPAILAFERAQLLAPRDATIRADLARTRETAGLSVAPRSRLDATLGVLTSDEWTWLAIAAGILACTGTVAYAWSMRRSLARTLAIAGGLGGGLAVAAAVEVAPSPAAAIVLHASTARIAPFAAAEAAFAAPEGEAVTVEQDRGDFVYVRDADRAGWLPRAEVERVVAHEPAAAHT